MVLRGSVTFRVGDEKRELETGGTWSIPPNAPHEVHAGAEGAVVLDVFAPVREDWQELERLPVTPPLWP
jgi:quercetin dioxygenase-like cupin family protein